MSIGPYQIIEALGSGANGEVYLAEDLRLGRKVAIKTLSALGRKEPSDARGWMLREARAAARLNHPHIAGVYDVVESPQGAHIVMEYVRGETLAFRVREGPLPPGQVLEIAIQLTDALAEAHAMGVVHRDLKPANVMITPKGDVKILDFGLAQVRPVEPGSTPVRSSRDFTLDGRQVGTPSYMPPEHLMGDPVDARGDLYSLGVMLYELLTGRRPFRAPDAMKLTMAILTEPTPKASCSNPAVPEALDAVVFRAMSRLPQDRFASASEMAANLRRAAAGVAPAVPHEGVSDAPTASRPSVWPIRVSRKQRAASVGGLGLVVALAVYGAVSRGRSPIAARSMGSPVVAVLPLAGITGDPQDESLATGIADSLISGLSRIPGLTVVSRQATLPYRDRKKGMETIGRDLGANLMIDGSVQRSGERLRIALSLLRVGSNRVAWSAAYDGTVSEIFSLQSQATSELADAMRVRLSPDERRRIQEPPTENVEAYTDYSQARTFFERPDVKGNADRAISLLQAALIKDPKFAKAHAALAESYLQKYTATHDLAWGIKARDSVTEALRLAPNDGRVRYSLAVVHRATGKTDEAIDELRRALELQPASDDAHDLLGQLLAARGQLQEGIIEIRKAIALNPNFWSHYHQLALIQFNAGRYAGALSAAQRETELQPDNSRGFQLLGTIYHAMGHRERAIANYEEAIRLGPSARAYTNLGAIHYAEGRYKKAAAAFEEAANLEPNPAKFRNLGDTYDRLGQRDDARRAYGKAVNLSLEALTNNPRDAAVIAGLAVYQAKLSDCGAAARSAATALSISPAVPEILYRQAVVNALCGRPEEGLAALEKALNKGYSVKFAQNDDDLATLRQRPRYERLMASHH
jgi:tetratricopeptide (TPR) repeat protein